jgi:hypothetical protein
MLLIWIPLFAFGEEEYAGEKKTMMDMIETIEIYNAAMSDAESTDEVARANNQLSDNLEVHAPRMKDLSEKYPEWGEAPPDEIRPLMDRYIDVFTTFNGESLKKSVDYANTYSDDQELQESFNRLNMIIMKLY